MFRLYEDDDFLNDLGEGTDQAYTSGLQVNFYYNLNHKPKFLIARMLPKAGDSSIDTYSIGLMQIMYTPDFLSSIYYVPNDYSYAGADVGKYELYSYNAKKKYDLQTEIVFGIMGPATYAGQAQHWLHTVIHDTAIPNGWGNQYNNAPLLNVNFTVEKELFHRGIFNTMGSAQVFAGTMLDGMELNGGIYIGNTDHFFDGFMEHYSTSFAQTERGWNKVHLYFWAKAAGQYILYSAMLQGGLFSSPPMVKVLEKTGSTYEVTYIQKPELPIENFVCYGAYGPVLAYRHFSISYTQTYSSKVLKNVYSYIYGNITVYYSW